MQNSGSPDPDQKAADEVAQRCLALDARSPSPAELVLRHEDRAEEWHFDEAIHKSRLDEHRARSVALKERERKAKEQHARDLEDHERQIAELLASAEAEERRCALEIAALREELVEAQHQIDDLEDECEQQVIALEQEMRAERQRRAALEEDMLKERESVEKATQRIQEIQDREGELMRSKRAQMAEHRSACQRQCLEGQRVTDQKIHELGMATREEIDAIQKQIEEKMKETEIGVDSWVKRRRDVGKDITQHIHDTVDSKVEEGLAFVQSSVMEEREKSQGQIKELQARDHEQEDYLRARMDAAFESVQSSVRERDEISMLEKYHKQQLEAATEVLGSSVGGLRRSVSQSRPSIRTAGSLVLGTS